MKKDQMGKRIVILIVGVFFMGLGAAFLTKANFGSDAVLVFQQGVANTFNLELGVSITIINVVLLLVLIFVNKKMINLGTVVVVVIAGPWVSLLLNLGFLPSSDSFWLSMVYFLIASSIVTFGVSLYIYADIGFAPLEGIIMSIQRKTKIRFGIIKIFHDGILFLIGWLLGGRFWVGSVISIFLFGPLIDFYTALYNRIGLLKPAIEEEANHYL